MLKYDPETDSYVEVGGDYNTQMLPSGNDTTTPGDPGGPGPNPPSGNDTPPGTGGGGTAPPGVSAAEQAVIDYYNKYLGRAPQAGDVQKWLSGEYGWGGSGNLAGIETGIRMSDEGARYGATHAPAGGVAPYSNFATTGNDYSAFNTARQQDPNKSAKDSFVYWSNKAPGPPLGDKAAMEKWFQAYIAPGMNAQGHKVTSISGDSFTYSNGEGTFTVDYAQNAGGAAGANRRLQWNATPADAATAAKYGSGTQSSSLTGGGGGGYGGAGGGGGAPSGDGYNWPTLDIPHYDEYPAYTPTPFVAPKPEDVQNDPAYQFRFDEGMKPLTNSRALAGLTRSGGTMKAMQRYGSNFASDEFNRIYGRAVNDWTMNNDTGFRAWQANAGEHQNAYSNWANEAIGEFNPKLDVSKLQFGRDWDIYKYQNDNAYRYWSDALNASTAGGHFGEDKSA